MEMLLGAVVFSTMAGAILWALNQMGQRKDDDDPAEYPYHHQRAGNGHSGRRVVGLLALLIILKATAAFEPEIRCHPPMHPNNREEKHQWPSSPTHNPPIPIIRTPKLPSSPDIRSIRGTNILITRSPLPNSSFSPFLHQIPSRTSSSFIPWEDFDPPTHLHCFPLGKWMSNRQRDQRTAGEEQRWPTTQLDGSGKEVSGDGEGWAPRKKGEGGEKVGPDRRKEIMQWTRRGRPTTPPRGEEKMVQLHSFFIRLGSSTTNLFSPLHSSDLPIFPLAFQQSLP